MFSRLLGEEYSILIYFTSNGFCLVYNLLASLIMRCFKSVSSSMFEAASGIPCSVSTHVTDAIDTKDCH